jgi:hypothetical protein
MAIEIVVDFSAFFVILNSNVMVNIKWNRVTNLFISEL